MSDYPTVFAYEALCKADRAKAERIKELEVENERLSVFELNADMLSSEQDTITELQAVVDRLADDAEFIPDGYSSGAWSRTDEALARIEYAAQHATKEDNDNGI